MQRTSRFVMVNGSALRTHRLTRGLTQAGLGRLAGYTDRLVRKAEKGGTLDIATIQNLAEALSMSGEAVSSADLTLDLLSIAKLWVKSFEELEARMVPEIASFLAPEFEFVCPGDPNTAPFIGTWKGAEGMQQFLDLFFQFFEREPAQNVEYFVGENSVVARWLESSKIQGVASGPVRINMHFEFRDGLISRMCDEYDTQQGAAEVEKVRSKLNGNGRAE